MILGVRGKGSGKWEKRGKYRKDTGKDKHICFKSADAADQNVKYYTPKISFFFFADI